MKSALVLTLGLVSAPVLAMPTLAGDDARVTVSADHAEWTGAAPEAHGDSIDIPLKAGATAAHIVLDDRTVKRIDVVDGATPHLVVRLHHSKATTIRTVEVLQITQTDGMLHVAFPREPAHAVAQAAPPSEKPAPVKAEPVAKTIEAFPETKPETKPETQAAPLAFAEEPSHGAGRLWSILLLIGLAGIGIVAAILRKKNAQPAIDEPFRVVATRTLGPKSKLMMVEVEDKKMLFAVDDKGTRLVSTWAKPRTEAASEDALSLSALEDELDSIGLEPNRASTSPSPAIAGLLKLRQRHEADASIEQEEPSNRASDARWGEAHRALPDDGGRESHTQKEDWAEMLVRATNRRGPS